MSFSPLPRTFLDDLRACRPDRVIEAGCGDGRFSAVLAACGVRPWRLDRRPPARGTVADAAADARELPLADGSCDLLVAANLLRQLWPLAGGAAVPPDWRRCLAAGGKLWIFEDEPSSRPAAARNYRDLQRFLAEVAPESRRPLLPRSRFVGRLGAERRDGRWAWGDAWNETGVDNLEAVLQLLRGTAGRGGGRPAAAAGAVGPAAVGEAARLEGSLRRSGLSYGRFWWARWTAGG